MPSVDLLARTIVEPGGATASVALPEAAEMLTLSVIRYAGAGDARLRTSVGNVGFGGGGGPGSWIESLESEEGFPVGAIVTADISVESMVELSVVLSWG